MRSFLLALCLTLVACIPEAARPDAGQEEDAGSLDAGTTDAGSLDAGSSDAGGLDAGPAQQFCRDLIQAQAGMQHRCGAVSDAGIAGLVLSIQEECDRYPLPRRDFVPSAVAACLQSYDVSCSTVIDTSRCEAVLPGVVEANGACFENGECKTGLFCDTSATCPGVCKPRVAIGQPATTSEQCVPEGFVSEGLCAARVALGQSCAALTPTGQRRECVAGGFCNSSSICVAQSLAGQGEDCDDVYPPCAAGLACAGGSQGCVPFADEGAPCGFVSGKACKIDLLCAASVCVRPGVSGQLCNFERACQWTSYCKRAPGMVDGTCEALPAENETCGRFGECAAGLFCDFSTDRCAPRRVVGQMCSTDNECQQFTHCAPSTKTCAALKSAGAACTSGSECQSGTCVSSRCTPSSFCFEP